MIGRRAVATTWHLLQRLTQRLGIAMFIREENHHYASDVYGRHASESKDIRMLPLFGSTAAASIESGQTLLYFDRLFTLYQCLEAAHRITTDRDLYIAEVGVYRGGTLAFLGEIARGLDATPHLIGFDTFEGHDKRDADAPVPTPGVHHAGLFGDTDIDHVAAVLSQFEHVSLLRGRVQDTFATSAPDLVHLVHIDTDLYEPTLFALRSFGRVLAHGGAMIVDDFRAKSCPGVERAVFEFLRDEPDWFTLQPLTKQCVLVRI